MLLWEAAKAQRLKQINSRLRAATPRGFRRSAGPSIPALLIAMMMLGAVGVALTGRQAYFADPAVRATPMKDRARHLLALLNCTAARLVGVAPARRGEPGYWHGHDADEDGVACEPVHVWKL